MASGNIDLGLNAEGAKPDTSMDEQAWLTTKTSELVDKSKFTKQVAKAWDDSSFSTKFGQFHPNWQRVMLNFAKRVKKIKDE